MAQRRGVRGGIGLRLEALEQRLLLSGNVVAEVASGSLVLTGDALGNTLLVEHGLAPTQLSLTPQDSTTINGSAGPILLDGITMGIRADLGAGGDQLLVQNVSLPGSFVLVDPLDGVNLQMLSCTFGGSITATTVEGSDLITLDTVQCVGVKITRGDGDGEIDIEDSGINGSVSVKTGEGTHNLKISGCAVIGALKVANGPGDSSTKITDSTTIGGSASVVSGAGYDTLELSGVVIAGSLKLGFGTAGAEVQIQNNSTIAGSLSITSSEGLNELDMEDSQVLGATKLAYTYSDNMVQVDNCTLTAFSLKETGSGHREATFKDSAINGKFSLAYGTGGVTVSIDDVDFLSSVAVKSAGSLSINIKHGNVGGKLAASAVDGDPLVQLHEMTLQSAFSWKTTAARDTVLLEGCNILGKTQVAAGALDDVFTLTDCIFQGAFALDMGDGADTAYLDVAGAGPASEFRGAVSAKLGSGDDTLTIGAESAGNGITTVSSAVFDGGSDYDSVHMTAHGNLFLVPPVFVGFEATV